jgi:hypothetical protein
MGPPRAQTALGAPPRHLLRHHPTAGAGKKGLQTPTAAGIKTLLDPSDRRGTPAARRGRKATDLRAAGSRVADVEGPWAENARGFARLPAALPKEDNRANHPDR